MKIEWKQKLTSRKFWLTITEFVTMMMIAFGFDVDVAVQVTAIIMAGAGVIAYVFAEGFIDGKKEESADTAMTQKNYQEE